VVDELVKMTVPSIKISSFAPLIEIIPSTCNVTSVPIVQSEEVVNDDVEVRMKISPGVVKFAGAVPVPSTFVPQVARVLGSPVALE
jgi:hypothetical protein